MQCGKAFEAKRSTARYCSDRCRWLAHNAKDAPTLKTNAKAEAGRIIANAKTVSVGDVTQAEIDALPQALRDDINGLCDSDPKLYDDRRERLVRAVLYRRKFPDKIYHSNQFTGKDRSLAKPGDADYPEQQGTSTCKYCGAKLDWDILECCGPCAWQPETREQRRTEVMAG